MRIKVGIVFVCSFLSACQALKPLRPPQFNYKNLAQQYFRHKLKSHFPLTTQRGVNLHPAASHNGYLFYTADLYGSGDIWMRDLRNTNNLLLVKDPAEQYKPTVNAKGDLIAFVSEDQDENGNLHLLSLEPQKISERYLRGISPSNLWSDSVNLSSEIEEWADEYLPEECRGTYGENDPDLNASGDRLLFITDRCTPGTYNIWLAELDDGELKALKQLTHLGGTSPRASPDDSRIVFISHRNKTEGDKAETGRIYLLELTGDSNKEQELALPQGPGQDGSFYYYAHPDFLGNSQTLAYTTARKDTNQDGTLNSQDHAAIYSVSIREKPAKPAATLQEKPLEGKPFRERPLEENSLEEKPLEEKPLLESSAVLHGLSYSHLIGGALLYVASLYNSINIYFVPASGIIPQEASIEEQYQASRRYLTQNKDRYLLALAAVKYYFEKQHSYILYEARVLVDRLLYYRKIGDRASMRETEAEIQERLSQNPYLEFHYQTHQRRKSALPLLGYMLDFQKSLSEKKFVHLSKSQAQLIQAAVTHNIAKEYRRQKQFPQALTELRRLNAKYPKYSLRNHTLLSQAELEFSIDQKTPSVFDTMAKQAQPRLMERIHKDLYTLYTQRADLDKNTIETQLKKQKPSLHPLLGYTLKLVLAHKLLQEARYEESLSHALAIQSKIPKYKSAFRSLPKKGWGGLYTHCWLIIEQSYRGLGKIQRSFAARIEIVSTYTKESGIDIESAHFAEFIDHFDQQIQVYLKTARSLAQKYQEHQKKQTKPGENVYIKLASSLATLAQTVGETLAETFSKIVGLETQEKNTGAQRPAARSTSQPMQRLCRERYDLPKAGFKTSAPLCEVLQ